MAAVKDEGLFSFYDVTVTSGRSFAFEVSSNPSTGFEWSVCGRMTDAIVPVRRRFLEKRTDLHIVGAPGMEQFTYRAVRPGVWHFVLQYSRRWEKEIAPVRYLVCTITVKR